jgi:disulfide bond formation protein DsbB
MKDILDSALVATLDRLILFLMLLALAGVLTAAMGFQYLNGEIPCPLCLLERVAMFACCFGLIQQIRDGGSQHGAGIAMTSAVVLMVISVRQTLLDIVPRPGHAYIGSPVFGLHMAVWSVLVAVSLLIGFAVRLAVLGGPNWAPPAERSRLSRLSAGLGLYVAILCAINFVSVFVQCGFGQCHTTGYALLR